MIECCTCGTDLTGLTVAHRVMNDEYHPQCLKCAGVEANPFGWRTETTTTTDDQADRRHAQMVLAQVLTSMIHLPGASGDQMPTAKAIATQILAWQPGKGKPTEGDGVDYEWTVPCLDCGKSMRVHSEKQWVNVMDDEGNTGQICVECEAKRHAKGGKSA